MLSVQKPFVIVGGLLVLGAAVLWPSVAGAASDISVSTLSGPSITETIMAHLMNSWPWYITRGSGLVAAAALFILMLSGIGQVTGATYRFLEPLTAWATHRALGIVFGISVVLHVVPLLIDRFQPFSIAQVLVPWLSTFKPVTIWGLHLGSLYVALGVLALYGTIAVVVTSLVWIDKKPKIWKWIHVLAYAVMAMVFVHALFIGTDTGSGWLRWVWIGGGVVLVAGLVHRAWRAFTTV